jgi:hypothetical protein
MLNEQDRNIFDDIKPKLHLTKYYNEYPEFVGLELAISKQFVKYSSDVLKFSRIGEKSQLSTFFQMFYNFMSVNVTVVNNRKVNMNNIVLLYMTNTNYFTDWIYEIINIYSNILTRSTDEIDELVNEQNVKMYYSNFIESLRKNKISPMSDDATLHNVKNKTVLEQIIEQHDIQTNVDKIQKQKRSIKIKIERMKNADKKNLAKLKKWEKFVNKKLVKPEDTEDTKELEKYTKQLKDQEKIRQKLEKTENTNDSKELEKTLNELKKLDDDELKLISTLEYNTIRDLNHCGKHYGLPPTSDENLIKHKCFDVNYVDKNNVSKFKTRYYTMTANVVCTMLYCIKHELPLYIPLLGIVSYHIGINVNMNHHEGFYKSYMSMIKRLTSNDTLLKRISNSNYRKPYMEKLSGEKFNDVSLLPLIEDLELNDKKMYLPNYITDDFGQNNIYSNCVETTIMNMMYLIYNSSGILPHEEALADAIIYASKTSLISIHRNFTILITQYAMTLGDIDFSSSVGDTHFEISSNINNYLSILNGLYDANETNLLTLFDKLFNGNFILIDENENEQIFDNEDDKYYYNEIMMSQSEIVSKFKTLDIVYKLIIEDGHSEVKLADNNHEMLKLLNQLFKIDDASHIISNMIFMDGYNKLIKKDDPIPEVYEINQVNLAYKAVPYVVSRCSIIGRFIEKHMCDHPELCTYKKMYANDGILKSNDITSNFKYTLYYGNISIDDFDIVKQFYFTQININCEYHKHKIYSLVNDNNNINTIAIPDIPKTLTIKQLKVNDLSNLMLSNCYVSSTTHKCIQEQINIVDRFKLDIHKNCQTGHIDLKNILNELYNSRYLKLHEMKSLQLHTSHHICINESELSLINKLIINSCVIQFDDENRMILTTGYTGSDDSYKFIGDTVKLSYIQKIYKYIMVDYWIRSLKIVCNHFENDEPLTMDDSRNIYVYTRNYQSFPHKMYDSKLTFRPLHKL